MEQALQAPQPGAGLRDDVYCLFPTKQRPEIVGMGPAVFCPTAALGHQADDYGGCQTLEQKYHKLLCTLLVLTTIWDMMPASQKFSAQVLYYLSGLTCNDENVIQKSGCQRKAAELGIAFVAPDTSPRGLNIEGEDESWDFGSGAGFYLNATRPKWKQYRMYDYIISELPQALDQIGGLDTSKVSQMLLQLPSLPHAQLCRMLYTGCNKLRSPQG